MEEHQCPICHLYMAEEHKIRYKDYFCDKKTDHHYAFRVMEQTVIKERIRLTDANENLCLKIHYDDLYSEVWIQSDFGERIRVDTIVKPTFDNLPKLKEKIRMLLVFS